MYNHTDKNYKSPICIAIKGEETADTLIRQSDIVFKDDLVMAFISSFFIGNNLGHIIISPTKHFENIYDLPINYAAQVAKVAKIMALAMKKAYQAEGVTTLQNNEPAGNQHAFHYHFHVFPRYVNDDLYRNILNKRITTFEERKPYAEKIKAVLENLSIP